MKSTWLTVPELASVLKLNVLSIRRAYWKGHLPVIRIGRIVRFDLDQVRQAIQQNGILCRPPLTPRRERPPARPAAPADGATGNPAPD